EKVKASELSKAAGAHFVKTSTGFAGGGATPEDVKLMKDTVGDALEVKASGGVRNLDDFKAMLDAGATRVGASAGVQIMQGLEVDTDY
ncbi:2-deoxyribose-5-phosphate aldolase, partial [Staphylococcus felis]